MPGVGADLAGQKAGGADDAHAHEAERDADVVQPARLRKPDRVGFRPPA